MPRAGLSAEVVTRTAADLADRLGLAAVTLAAVARQLGVKAPSLYAHLAGEADLRQRIALLAIAEINDETVAALAGRAGRDAVEALAETIRSYALRHPGRYAASRTPLDTRTAAGSAGPRQADLLRAVLRGYAITDPVEAVHAIRVLSGLIVGVVDLEAAGSFDHSDPPPQDSWARVVDVLDATLRAWPPLAPRAI